MITILLTGFEPFGGETENPSSDALARLAGEAIPGVRLETAALPCVFGGAIEAMRAAIERCSPGAVIATGMAAGRPGISVERVAINLDDATSPDNAGFQPVDRPVVEGGPAAYFSTLPVKAIVERVSGGGIPASLSWSAGAYVCNHLFYGLRHLAETERPAMAAGFIHVPYLTAQAARHPGQPGMELETIARGLLLAIEAVRDSLAIAPAASA